MILGVDPGLHGALAFYDLAMPGPCIEVFDMPTHTITVNGKQRTRLDLHQLADLVARHAARCTLAVIEDVHAMPKQGVSSSFSFGFAAGAAQAIVAAHDIPVRMVQPAAWKRAYGLTSDKDASRQRASQLLPAFAHLWPLAKHDGRAEAVLLALYGGK